MKNTVNEQDLQNRKRNAIGRLWLITVGGWQCTGGNEEEIIDECIGEILSN